MTKELVPSLRPPPSPAVRKVTFQEDIVDKEAPFAEGLKEAQKVVGGKMQEQERRRSQSRQPAKKFFPATRKQRLRNQWWERAGQSSRPSSFKGSSKGK